MQTDSSLGQQPHSPLGDSLFASRMHEIQRTNNMLNQLENKLNGFFNERKDSSKKSSPGTQRQDFRLINPRSNTGERRTKHHLEELMNRKTQLSSAKQKEPNTERQNPNPTYSASKQAFRSEQVNQLNRMEQYYKRKNALIESKILQLQQELDIDQQEKLSLFQQNQRTEKELKDLHEALPTEQTVEEGSGELGLAIIELEKELEAKKQTNRRLQREVDTLKQNYKTIKRTKTQYMQNELKEADEHAMREIHQLKEELAREKQNHRDLRQQFAKNEQIQRLKLELGRLKRLVILKAGSR